MTDSFIGTPDRIRTYDLWLRKPTLYPAELRVLVLPYAPASFCLSAKALACSYGRPLKIVFSRFHSLDYDFGIWVKRKTFCPSRSFRKTFLLKQRG